LELVIESTRRSSVFVLGISAAICSIPSALMMAWKRGESCIGELPSDNAHATYGEVVELILLGLPREEISQLGTALLEEVHVLESVPQTRGTTHDSYWA